MFVSPQPVRACACAWGATVIDHNYRISDEDAFVSPLPALTPGLLAEEKRRNATGERLSWRRAVIQQRDGGCLPRQPAVRVSCAVAPSQLPPLSPLMDRKALNLRPIQRFRVFSPQICCGKPGQSRLESAVESEFLQKYHRNPRRLLRLSAGSRPESCWGPFKSTFRRDFNVKQN